MDDLELSIMSYFMPKKKGDEKKGKRKEIPIFFILELKSPFLDRNLRGGEA